MIVSHSITNMPICVLAPDFVAAWGETNTSINNALPLRNGQGNTMTNVGSITHFT